MCLSFQVIESWHGYRKNVLLYWLATSSMTGFPYCVKVPDNPEPNILLYANFVPDKQPKGPS